MASAWSFSAPVSVTPGPINIDWGPDARPRIAVDGSGHLIVTYATFQDQRFNGRAFYTRSTDNGASFAAPQPLTPLRWMAGQLNPARYE